MSGIEKTEGLYTYTATSKEINQNSQIKKTDEKDVPVWNQKVPDDVKENLNVDGYVAKRDATYVDNKAERFQNALETKKEKVEAVQKSLPPRDGKTNYIEDFKDYQPTNQAKYDKVYDLVNKKVDPEKAMEMAIDFKEKPVMITDSGDNVTSGATGWNTYILRQALTQNSEKSFLFANICDPKAFEILNKLELGHSTNIKLGMDSDENSASVDINVTVKGKGYLRGYLMHVHDAVYGYSVLVHVNGTNIDINVASTRQTMCEKHQFDACGINWDNYDIIVVKQGYAFPEIKEKGKLVIMSLTNGSTLQDTSRLPFKRIMRPMYPIDNI